MRQALLVVFGISIVSGNLGCGHHATSAQDSTLTLRSVVLYRNGVGYFERRGAVDGSLLTLRVRKDQLNDLLKSLTIVDRQGHPLSVSMPLDPKGWANAAFAALTPGQAGLARALDALRGTPVRAHVGMRHISGRIVMVEPLSPAAQTMETGTEDLLSGAKLPSSSTADYRIALLQGDKLQVAKLSEVSDLELLDRDIALLLHRSLDAAAGDGLAELVEVQVRLAKASTHDLTLSYVVAAPIWKPTYRIVLPPQGKSKALLQGWAVVDNTSGEDWNGVELSLTAGAPISFRYDLHSPRQLERPDLSDSAVHKQAEVALGEANYGEPPVPEAKAAPQVASEAAADEVETDARVADAPAKSVAKRGRSAAKEGAAAPMAMAQSLARGESGETASRDGGGLQYSALQRSTVARTRAQQVSGLTRIDLKDKLDVPDRSSTMIAVLNTEVEAEEAFLFKEGGAGQGYEDNPYRIVRFVNESPYALEPGPISIFSNGSFVGEGLSETVGSKASVTIPFAVEPSIRVTAARDLQGAELRITRIVGGVIEAQRFQRTTTTWTARAPARPQGYTVWIRHQRQEPGYQLLERPKGTEDRSDGYLVPMRLGPGDRETSLRLVEQTPVRTSMSIWDGGIVPLLDSLLQVSELTAEMRQKLQPILELRRDIARIDTEAEGLQRQQREIDARAQETRENLKAIQKDPKAGELRRRVGQRLEEFSKQSDALARQLVELASRRLEKKIALEDKLQALDLQVPAPSTNPKP